jgi:predicted dehydrogenase
VEAEHFIECVAKRARPTTDGEHGLAVVRILEALQRSLKTGGRAVKITWQS